MIKSPYIYGTLAGMLFLTGHAAAALPAGETLQQRYTNAGAGPYDADAGRRFWTQTFEHKQSPYQRGCTDCHGKDLKQSGRHIKTKKTIKPLAPSANPESLGDIKHIEKWFKRNCRWTLKRLCTPQEKGDVLEFLKSQ